MNETEFTHEGRTFIATVEYDDNAEAPWERSDGHGPVSEWTSRAKLPGERILGEDRGQKRYYDWQAAIKQAYTEGWGLSDEDKQNLLKRRAPRTDERLVEENGVLVKVPEQWATVTLPGRDPAKPLTRGEIVEEAVRLDFEFLRGWFNNHWQYVGVTVRHVSQDESDRYKEALWGIESCSKEYIEEIKLELAGQVIEKLQEEERTLQEEIASAESKVKALEAELANPLPEAVAETVNEKLESLREKISEDKAALEGLLK